MKTGNSVTDGYHLMEFAIARDPTDPRHVNPPPFPPDRRVLDIGCGAGQTLITCYGDRRAFGVDVALDALRLGRTLTKRVSFVCAAAERLPFREDESNRDTIRGLIRDRVLPLLREIHPAADANLLRALEERETLPPALAALRERGIGFRSLREIRRVLKPGGFFWAVLHPISVGWNTVDPRKPRTLLRFAYVTLNSLLFHFTGSVAPYRRGRYESFQTSWGIRRALRAAGFARVTVRRQTHFVVTAEAAPSLSR